MGFSPKQYGTTITMYFTNSYYEWFNYRPDKIRIRCSAKWQTLRIVSGFERTMINEINLNVEANEWAEFTLPWIDAQGEHGFMSIEVGRDWQDPTPNNLGAVMTDMEFGPQELQASSPT